jgi:fructokinase
MTDPLYAGVELGGTKSIAVLGTPAAIVDRFEWPTSEPETLLPRIHAQLADWHDRHGLSAIGIASFGPLWLDPARPHFGRMDRTPKPGWSDAPIVEAIRGKLDLPVALDTDVAGAGLAEGRLGAARGAPVHVYATVGTGMGAALIIDGRPVHGLQHPEIGHARVRRVAGDDFPGACPFHGDCLEGLVCGPAIAARAGRPAGELDPDHPVWAKVGAELGEFVALMILAAAPHRIVFGGGVILGQDQLLPLVRQAAADSLAGYGASVTLDDLQSRVLPAALGRDAGPIGALILAEATAGPNPIESDY